MHVETVCGSKPSCFLSILALLSLEQKQEKCHPLVVSGVCTEQEMVSPQAVREIHTLMYYTHMYMYVGYLLHFQLSASF